MDTFCQQPQFSDKLPLNGGGTIMRIQQERQRNPVADEVLALTAVVRPILKGLLYALKGDIANELGGYEELKLKMLPRAGRRSDGDCGVCFEYAVHDALTRGDARVMERISDAARLCNLSARSNPQSILASSRVRVGEF
jgi:hypothetical protein